MPAGPADTAAVAADASSTILERASNTRRCMLTCEWWARSAAHRGATALRHTDEPGTSSQRSKIAWAAASSTPTLPRCTCSAVTVAAKASLIDAAGVWRPCLRKLLKRSDILAKSMNASTVKATSSANVRRAATTASTTPASAAATAHSGSSFRKSIQVMNAEPWPWMFNTSGYACMAAATARIATQA